MGLWHLFQFVQAFVDNGGGVGGDFIGVGIFGEIAHGDDGVFFLSQIIEEDFELIGVRVDPGMGGIGHAMELQDGDFASAGLADSQFKIIEFPVGTRVAGGG